MTEIPEDIQRLAENAYINASVRTNKDYPKDMVRMVALAILAEREAQRERDAKIADQVAHRVKEKGWPSYGATEAAAAIRKG